MKLSSVLKGIAATCLWAAASQAATVAINNGIPQGTVGSFEVNMAAGGDIPGNSQGGPGATITAQPTGGGALVTDSTIIFDYITYVNTGSGGVDLGGSSTSGPTAGPNNTVVSSGTFTGSNGNAINWTATTSLASHAASSITTYQFSAVTGKLGNVSLAQYLDEDVASSPGDDAFFSKGSAATNDLQLFTVDSNQLYGISHSGAYSTASGLVSSTFNGYSVDSYNNMKPKLSAGTETFSPTGVFAPSLPSTTLPVVGSALGPIDIVTALEWSVDPNATSSTIITSLGGLPDITQIPPPPVTPPTSTPLPAASWMGLSVLALMGLGMAFKKRASLQS